MSAEEQQKYYARSSWKWTKKRRQMGRKYTEKQHLDWVDKDNVGVSHFGIHPAMLPRYSIRFDVFHLRSAITKKLMSYLRNFILSQTCEIMKKFQTQVLSTFWKPYHILVWKLNKKFNRFNGEEIKAFVYNIPKVDHFLKSTFEMTDHLEIMCKSLNLWLEITPFLHKTTVLNRVTYENEICTFENNVIKLYECGSKTFLTKINTGDQETFYMHVLRFYMPDIARETLHEHNLGIGVFTMQGFERRNKESKNTLRRFSNNRGNLVISNLKRLWDVFSHGQNAV